MNNERRKLERLNDREARRDFSRLMAVTAAALAVVYYLFWT